MPRLDEDKVALYKRLTGELELVEENHFKLKDIIKANHKTIRDLREDISHWKETCFRQSDSIYRLYLINGIQCIIILGIVAWTSIIHFL